MYCCFSRPLHFLWSMLNDTLALDSADEYKLTGTETSPKDMVAVPIDLAGIGPGVEESDCGLATDCGPTASCGLQLQTADFYGGQRTIRGGAVPPQRFLWEIFCISRFVIYGPSRPSCDATLRTGCSCVPRQSVQDWAPDDRPAPSWSHPLEVRLQARSHLRREALLPRESLSGSESGRSIPEPAARWRVHGR